MFDSLRLMNCSTPGSPVLHCLPEFAQTHVYSVSEAIQPSYLLLLPSIFPISVFSVSRLFILLGGQSIGASASASILPMNIHVDFL